MSFLTHAARTTTLAAASLTLLALAGCNGGDDDNNDQPTSPPALSTIPVTAQNGGYTTLVTAVTAADLGTTLSGAGPFTVFAPTNAAFAGLGSTLTTLLEPGQQATLASILTYHVLNSSVDSAAAIAAAGSTSGGDLVVTVNSDSILLDVVAGTLYVNEARVTAPNIQASNGIIHGIDQVIRPRQTVLQTLTDRGLTSLVDAIGTAGLTTALSGTGTFTVMAPTNAAFTAIAGTVSGLSTTALADVLTSHVIAGNVKASAALATTAPVATLNTALNMTFQVTGGVPQASVGGGTPAGITTINIACTNGIIHVIDTVLLPAPSAIAAR
jgi:uncharacterized surface protein with fasciclin (FAS1) repeats